MKKPTYALLALFAFTFLPLHAASLDDLTYSSDDTSVTITDCDESASGALVIPDTIDGLVVTSVNSEAFAECTSLTSITIPDSVTSIGTRAFQNCTSLSSITIPDSVTSIGDYAFYLCTSLTSITMPDSVTSIGGNPFSTCNSLTAIEVGADNSNYSSEDGVLFNNDKTIIIGYPNGKTDPNYVIPDSVTSIGDAAFGGCTSLTSITIPDSVTSIGDFAFQNCRSLTSIIIPDSVTSIGRYAISNCTSLTSITIPDSVTSIEEYTFWVCTSLSSITIPDSVTSIGRGAFHVCTSLTSITIPDSVTSIEDYTFWDCTSLTSITIPDGVTSIGNYAFYKCTSLTSITIPDKVTSIGVNSFRGCTSLTSVTIGDGVTSIGNFAFYQCASLTSITIPDGVTRIGFQAFYDCTSLTSINFLPTTAPSLGANVFANLPDSARYNTLAGATGYTDPFGDVSFGATLVDSDGDGVFDNSDAFPDDSTEWADTDGDGVGDNADTDDDGDGVVDVNDAFPTDATETLDTDGDGVGDNSDAFPNDATETVDTDGDEVGDNSDAFLNDPNEWADTDSDGYGDNSDAFPNDPTEWADEDGNGIGDNADADSDYEFGGFLVESLSVGNYPRWVTAGDGDGSGKGIFVAADRNDDKVTSYVYEGGDWSQVDNLSVSNKPVQIISADFDGDNDLDVVTFDKLDFQVTSLLGDGSGNFSQSSTTGVGKKPQGGTIADLDGDEDLDLAVANYKGNSVSILFGDGAGGFSVSQTLSIGNLPMDVTAADIDNDSDMDLIMVDYKKVIYIIENNGGTFSEFDSISMSGNPGGPAAVGDFDDDGNIDFAVTDRSNDSVGVYFGNGNGTFSDPSDIDVGENPRDILAVDLDEDGVLDLAVANQDDNSLTTLLGDGTGVFPTSVTFSLEGGPVGISSYDYDGDGDMDLFAALPDVDEVAVLENVTGDKDDDGNFYSYNSGVVADGYIEGARVFLDQNGNEEWDEGEPYTFSGEEGQYVLVSPASDASIITEGGTDISTGTAFDAKLKGPRGSKVLSPLTSVVESMVRSGDVSDYETANKLLSESLGLGDEVIDFSNFDAIKRVNDASRSAEERSQASEVAQAAVQLGSVMNGYAVLGIESSSIARRLGAKLPKNPNLAAEFDLREKLLAAEFDLREKLSTSSEIEEIVDGSDDPQLKDRAEKLATSNDQIRRQSGTGGMAARQGELFSTLGIGPRAGREPRPGPFRVVKEQGQNVFNVSLKQAPTDDVMIDVSVDNLEFIVLSEDLLEFDATNWSQAQTVTISVEEDVEITDFSPGEIIFTINEDFTDDDSFLEMDPESFPFAIRPSGLQGDIRSERLLAENFGDPVAYGGKECKIYGSLETLGKYAQTDDVIGVYVGDELRGKISMEAFSEIGFFEGAIAVKADGEVATFKVFDASMGEILEVPDYSVSLESGAEIGSLTNPVSLTAGYSLADVIYDPRGPRGSTTRPKITSVTHVEGELRFKLKTQNNFNYRIESSEDMINWTEELMVVGNGSKIPIRVNAEGVGRKFIRARAEVAQGNDQGGGGGNDQGGGGL